MSNGQRVIAIGGGKGGVGKSFVAVNLAVSIAKTGRRVTMLDADFGAANLHALFGILRPERTVMDFVNGRADRLADVALETGISNLRILAGTCDVLGSADLAADKKRALLAGLGDIDSDVLIIDVGAGTSAHTVDLFNAADTRMVVMSPELTSAQNAYGFLKIAVFRRLQRAVEGHPAEARLREKLGQSIFEIGSTMQKVDTFISLVASEAPELEAPFRMLLRELNVKLVGNMLASEHDRNTIYALKRMITGFIGIDAEVAGAFRASPRVRRTVNSGVPLAALESDSDYDVAEFTRLARRVVDQDMEPIEALRRAISQAMVEAQAPAFVFGLDGIDIVELEEVTDPEELAALEAVEDEEEARANAVTDPPPQRVSRSGRPVPPPPPLDVVSVALDEPLPRFVTELERVRRKTARSVHVEVELFGHWFLGKLLSVDTHEVLVSGVHPFVPFDGRTCRVRLVHMRPEDEVLSVPVEATWRGYDAATGRAILHVASLADAAALSEHAPARPHVVAA